MIAFASMSLTQLLQSVAANTLGNKFRDELIAKIIDICAQNDYQFITNFEWYVSVLVDLARVEGGTEHGQLIANQMLDVAIRYGGLFSIDCRSNSHSAQSRVDQTFRNSANGHFARQLHTVHELDVRMRGAVRSRVDLRRVFRTPRVSVANRTVHVAVSLVSVPHRGRVRAQRVEDFRQNLSQRKVCHVASPQLPVLTSSHRYREEHDSPTNEFIDFCFDLKQSRLPRFQQSSDLEVQERAYNFSQLIEVLSELDGVQVDQLYHSYPLNPVAAKAQKKVPIPQGLDLDTPFVIVEADSDEGTLCVCTSSLRSFSSIAEQEEDSDSQRNGAFGDESSDEETEVKTSSKHAKRRQEREAIKKVIDHGCERGWPVN